MLTTLQELIAEQNKLEMAGASNRADRIALCQAEQLARIADTLEELLVMAQTASK
jgi:hypothetical protein